MSSHGAFEASSRDESGFPFTLIHHGGRTTVTGSCHEVRLRSGEGILVDCGLFQGDDAEREVGRPAPEEIGFPVEHLAALVVTHAHLDHVGRIPYLLAAGFRGPILCSEPSALLLPVVLEDAVKVGISRDRRLIDEVIDRVKAQLAPVPYGEWRSVVTGPGKARARVKLRPAGHILGSAFVEFEICRETGSGRASRLVFSGDLGAPYAPLLPAPKPGWRADALVLESTYGDGLHPDRRSRRRALQAVLEHALADGGTVLIPAFSLGRTQDLLYEIEGIIHAGRGKSLRVEGEALPWEDLEIVVDSPLAARFTEVFKAAKPFWDAEARRRVRHGRHPLSFEQLYTVDDHQSHLHTVEYLAESGRPAVVIAASGMATGGRIVNYLKAMIGDERNDVVFVGYQAAGTPGRAIQTYGPGGGYVVLDGRRYAIRAQIHALRSYSAHADQADLVRFASRFRHPPTWIRLIHGEAEAQRALARELERALPGVVVD